jgi:hypothetical protein
MSRSITLLHLSDLQFAQVALNERTPWSLCMW